MREIKFRAWNPVSNAMLWSERCKNLSFFFDLVGSFDLANGFELMQYTGLKDKNGVEIYEGDIVRVTIYGFGIEKDVVVEWTEDGYKEMCEDFHREVIGNIYENKELLN